jgi:hypothetical protein
MANTLLIAKQMMADAAAAGHRTLHAEQVRFIRSAYAGALASGREANAKHPGSKAAKLVRRFTRDAEDILRFTTDTAIWFSNNQSERDLRPTKLQLKISATWRWRIQAVEAFSSTSSGPCGPTGPPPANTGRISSTSSPACSRPAPGSHRTPRLTRAKYVRSYQWPVRIRPEISSPVQTGTLVIPNSYSTRPIS